MTELKTTIVSFEEFSDYQFIPPATFYVMGFDEKGNQAYYFFHTASRAKAQEKCNEMFDGKYTVVASKIQKGKGTCTAVGHQSKRGQKR